MKSDRDSPPVVFLLGPTACGKTGLAAALREHYDAELISVDAAQVYRAMDIGTAKPSRDFLRRHPHHLIDIREPDEQYCAAQFCADARALIADMHARGKLPVLVGGTMFYFHALENGLSELPPSNTQIRAQLDDEFAAYGNAAMHAQLADVDAKLARAIPPGDRQRVQRALEIYRLTRRRPSAAMRGGEPLRAPIIKLGVFTADRVALRARIAARFNLMLARGLIAEVESLLARLENPRATPSMRAVGYRQVCDYLRGDCDYRAMRDNAITATAQLAKRQVTWMRRWKNLTWIERTDDDADDRAEDDGVFNAARECLNHQLNELKN